MATVLVGHTATTNRLRRSTDCTRRRTCSVYTDLDIPSRPHRPHIRLLLIILSVYQYLLTYLYQQRTQARPGLTKT